MIMSETAAATTAFFTGFLQFDVQSGDISKNLGRVKEGLAGLSGSCREISPGIIVLPELWATDFAYEKLAQLAGNVPELLGQLQELAGEYQVLLAGSLPEAADNCFYNTLYIVGSDGIAGTYRKQQLFGPMAEDTFFSPGPPMAPIQTALGPVAGLVCYDLRFPELLRSQAAAGANLLAVISAQWPAARISHWRILVQARAIENQMFVVAANRCGTSGDTPFGGHSMIVGPDGAILLEAGEGEEHGGIMLDPDRVSMVRSVFSTVPTR